MTYKIGQLNCVTDVTGEIIFVIDPANTDYQRFKLDITNGVELLDADGNVMSESQVQQFLETLP